MTLLKDQIDLLHKGDFKTLARCISLVENEAENYEDLLLHLKPSSTKMIGLTGAPGVGKSTLADALIGEMVNARKKVGVVCVDPSSPFTRGAVLGDRIRMSEWYNNPDVFIRSLASKGSLGGLHPKMIEITDVMRSAGFDYIIIETVGVGQSEVDIAGLADIIVVTLVPEGGDVIQTMKAGLMEVADIFVINKYDRPDAESYYNNLSLMLAPAFNKSDKKIPIIKTIASQKQGIKELYTNIEEYPVAKVKKTELIFEKVWSIIQAQKMKSIATETLKKDLLTAMAEPGFNVYGFAEKYY